MPACPQCRTEVAHGARVCPSCRALQPLEHPGTLAKGATIDLGYGRLVLDERVGEGGMGVVHRAWLFHAPGTARAHEPPELVALKRLRRELAGDPEMRRLFDNEAEALRRLSHPNIVRFHDLFEHQGSLVLAVEYVDGDTLDDVVSRHVARARLAGGTALPGLAFRRAWYYFQQLLGALAAIHALGIVHRDVKPSNVLLRRDGVVKLTDFGIARFARTPEAEGFAPGTAAYMSPEQVMAHPVDGRSDLYAAGIVLFEMLAGRTPFATEGRSELAVRHDQVTRAPPPIRTFLAQAPPVLDGLFARALAKDPAHRFGSAVEMGDAFRVALGVPESPEWRALVDLAREAASPTVPEQRAAREARMATLREFVVERVRTARLYAM